MAQQKTEKNASERQAEQKTQTRYERRMEARKQQKIREARQERITRIIFSVVGVLLMAAIVISVAVPVVKKSRVLHGTYVKAGEHELSELEYDYFYNMTVNNYLASYASILPYMGLDTSVDFDKQQYTDELTWKDLFDEMTMEQVKQTKALADDAQRAGFVYDATAEYAQYQEELKEYAASAKVTVKEYYKQSFGPYATEKNVEPMIKEGMLANAYYEEQLAMNAPSDEEIKAYYEENRQSYDRVDYRSFTFIPELAEDADEDAVSAAMKKLHEQAKAMMEERKEGEDFEALCAKNASGEDKANYEEAGTEHCLSEGRTYAGITTVMADWLFEDGRKEGDIAVLEDEAGQRYYVVEFSDRYFDEADNESISNTIAGQRTSEHVAELVENYQVTDVKGNLNYLTVARTDVDEDGDSEAEDGGDAAEAEPADENAGE